VGGFSLAFLVMFSNYGAKHSVVKRLNIMTSHYNLYLQGVINEVLAFVVVQRTSPFFLDVSKTMGTNHPAMQHNIQEELWPPCDKTAL
jgi:hypothetical protein